jgi:endogenous inhibitor of DNA gyrase (YacG/DUF329 family)
MSDDQPSYEPHEPFERPAGNRPRAKDGTVACRTCGDTGWVERPTENAYRPCDRCMPAQWRRWVDGAYEPYTGTR